MNTNLLRSLSVLIFASCNSPESSVNTSIDVESPSCLLADERVSKDVFKEWETEYASFVQAHGYEEEGARLNPTTTMLTLPSALWSQFTDRCPDCTGARAYYGATLDSSSGVYQQFLMITNTSAETCNDTAFEEDGVLMLYPYVNSGFIDASTAAQYHATWKNYITEVQVRMPSMLYVEGYSFTREAFQDAFEVNDSILGIYYGMHTVMPSDTLYEHTTLNGGAEGWITFNLVVTSLDQTGGYGTSSHMDFARPCPKICPGKKFYYSED